METKDFLNILATMREKSIGYELDRVKINDDGTTTHIHSDRFLDEHPERKDNPEFTDEEELEMMKFIEIVARKV